MSLTREIPSPRRRCPLVAALLVPLLVGACATSSDPGTQESAVPPPVTTTTALAEPETQAPEDATTTATAAPETTAPQTPPGIPSDPPSSAPVDDEPTAAQPQENSCGWDVPALSSPQANAPTAQDGDLRTVIIGAWQHTHYNSGAGFVDLDEDIRYVFPSDGQLLYCQHIPGITEYAEHGSAFAWEGNVIAPPGAPGFEVVQWDATTMVWVNRLDESLYLLQRR